MQIMICAFGHKLYLVFYAVKMRVGKLLLIKSKDLFTFSCVVIYLCLPLKCCNEAITFKYYNYEINTKRHSN